MITAPVLPAAEGSIVIMASVELIVLPDRVSVPSVALPPVMLPATLMVLPYVISFEVAL